MIKNRLAIKGFIIFLFILSAAIIVRYLFKNWILITATSINLKSWQIYAYSGLLFLGHFLYIWIWLKLLIRLDVKLTYFELSKIHFSTLLIKYIPGKIFYPLSKGIFMGENGISTSKATLIILFDTFITFISALIISIASYIIYLIWPAGFKISTFYFLIFLTLIGLLFYLGNKKLTEKVPMWESKITLLFNFIPLYLLLIILDGLFFCFLINLFSPLRLEQLFLVIGINAGFKVIFSIIPNQIGIGELIQSLFLRYILSPPFFMLIPLFMRAWKLILEVSIFLILSFITQIKFFKNSITIKIRNEN